ncbi:16 kDa beta-galactoside-binding lectin-like [Callorhinchus milii]|uniref:Galectin n=1 Tax=Callorhinchus milii TaxID=7868 RepID=V9LFL7_CALMI|nr:16 kDa beta-galactoside-binding lectin-like [Callorhinchus milii]
MKLVLEMFNVNMKPGDTLKIKGVIEPDAERFAVNLGTDPSRYALHFNPRFDDEVDGCVIVCNNKEEGEWSTEQRDEDFPLKKGESFKISITFQGDVFEIKLPEDRVLEFPNRSCAEILTYLVIEGQVRVKGLKFDYLPEVAL